ncbi:BA75_04909T0 [Komagataella pastoris]|uniref:BA75_04909T0 n=1 Tax=Komagataella pastoris TaxID=4922 RepID=A0A1B2JII9_PICPA|nr:BA75_04909T0 [Komagataella pastoris]
MHVEGVLRRVSILKLLKTFERSLTLQVPQAVAHSILLWEVLFGWQSIHGSIKWFLQMAQVSTTISVIISTSFNKRCLVKGLLTPGPERHCCPLLDFKPFLLLSIWDVSSWCNRNFSKSAYLAHQPPFHQRFLST